MTDPTVIGRHAEWPRHYIPSRRQPLERESFVPIHHRYVSMPAFPPNFTLVAPCLSPLLPFLSTSVTRYPSGLTLCSLHCRVPFLRCTRIITNNSSNRSSSNSSNAIRQIPDLFLLPIHLLSEANDGMISSILRITRGSMPVTNSKDHMALCLIMDSTILP